MLEQGGAICVPIQYYTGILLQIDTQFHFSPEGFPTAVYYNFQQLCNLCSSSRMNCANWIRYCSCCSSTPIRLALTMLKLSHGGPSRTKSMGPRSLKIFKVFKKYMFYAILCQFFMVGMNMVGFVCRVPRELPWRR
jgi:hypothetical protein